MKENTTTQHGSGTVMEANAAFIVRACNAHDELVAALRQIVIEATESPNSDANRLELILEQARAALAKAGAA